MRHTTLLFLGVCTYLISGCGLLTDSGQDAYLNPANMAPGGRFKIDWVERGFSGRGLTRCQLNASQNGLGVLEVGFIDSESDSEMRLVLTGFNPQSNQHQIVGSGQSSGGSIFLKAGGDQRINSFQNQSSNGRGNSTQCQLRTRALGSYIEAVFQCYNLYNSLGQPKNASGEVRCQTDQYTWED